MSTTFTRAEAAKRFDELPLPSTADEHWRFTSLRGFDPVSGNGTVSNTALAPVLDLDVAGRVLVTSQGMEFVNVPDGNQIVLHRRYAPQS